MYHYVDHNLSIQPFLYIKEYVKIHLGHLGGRVNYRRLVHIRLLREGIFWTSGSNLRFHETPINNELNSRQVKIIRPRLMGESVY